jgi:4-hydroxy-tetrahydrodipicolinate reductase
MEELAQSKGGALFYASNFSIGVNIMFRINRRLAELMNPYSEYEVRVEETHHMWKKDAPSGTAITLAEGVLENLDRKEEWVLVDSQESIDGGQLGIVALREGKVPGTHIIKYDSEVDSITITHEAKSREGFALGAVVAAEFLVGKPAGFYSMTDLMNEE